MGVWESDSLYHSQSSLLIEEQYASLEVMHLSQHWGERRGEREGGGGREKGGVSRGPVMARGLHRLLGVTEGVVNVVGSVLPLHQLQSSPLL